MLIGIGLFSLFTLPAFGAPEQAGITSGTLFRIIGLVAAGLSIVGLILVQFVYHDRFHRTTRHWILLMLLLVFPLLSMLGAMETVMEETKSVASCNSCHVMEPFVEDMQNPNSATLAAQHFTNKWIPKNQCYQCHTTYGVHGTLAAKRDGFRHWLLYVTQTYEEPIQYSGSYPNVNCTSCHGGSPEFQAVEAHASLRESLVEDRVSCASCHGPPHPAPPDRPDAMTAHDFPTEPTVSAHD